MSVIVTGGAGFIGSCVVRALNDAGVDDIVVVDDIAQTEKWLNLRDKKYKEYFHKSRFIEKLPELHRGGYLLLYISAPVRPPRNGILITYIRTTLSIRRSCGSIARQTMYRSSMPAPPLHMGTEAGALTTGRISMGFGR